MKTRGAFEMIPAGAKIAAALVFAVIVALLYWFFDEHKGVGIGTVMGLVMGGALAAFILLAGYVYADASRRGMPAAPWTAMALLIPNGLGFVLYFLLRKPVVHPCSGCGGGVSADAAYCPKCGLAQVGSAVAC